MRVDNTFQISCPDFSEGENIPIKFTCRGENINPRLDIAGVPPETVGMALIMHDPDAPAGDYKHWLMWNISPEVNSIQEGQVPAGVVQGTGTSGDQSYFGPCPHQGTHRYVFEIFALKNALDIPAGSDYSALTTALDGNVLASASLTGKFSAV